jgi:hypothetical protein
MVNKLTRWKKDTDPKLGMSKLTPKWLTISIMGNNRTTIVEYERKMA